jgi:hypothetical protein
MKSREDEFFPQFRIKVYLDALASAPIPWTDLAAKKNAPKATPNANDLYESERVSFFLFFFSVSLCFLMQCLFEISLVVLLVFFFCCVVFVVIVCFLLLLWCVFCCGVFFVGCCCSCCCRRRRRRRCLCLRFL